MLRLLAFIAVLLMPLGMAAPVQAHSGMDMATMAHCPEKAGHHHSKGAVVECTMACASALPAMDRVSDQAAPVHRLVLVPLAARPLRSLHPDTATPPPKAA